MQSAVMIRREFVSVDDNGRSVNCAGHGQCPSDIDVRLRDGWGTQFQDGHPAGIQPSPKGPIDPVPTKGRFTPQRYPPKQQGTDPRHMAVALARACIGPPHEVLSGDSLIHFTSRLQAAP